MSIAYKKIHKEKEQGYGINANNDPSVKKIAIIQDALSHMGKSAVYRTAAAQSNKKKCLKEQICIVHIGLVFEQAYHPWSRDRYEYSSVELLDLFAKVCLPHTKKKNFPKVATMEHPPP